MESNYSSFQQISNPKAKIESSSIPINMIRKAGMHLGLSEAKIQNIIDPDEVRMFRLPVEIVGRTINIWGSIVLHNNARGPYKGGTKIAKDVDIWESTEIARIMTLKNAIVENPFGGGKSGIRINMHELYDLFNIEKPNPAFEDMVKRLVLKEFAIKFKDLFANHVYIPATDIGVDSNLLASIYNITKDPASVTSKPEGIPGWLPGRKESTGYSVSIAVLETLKYLEINHSSATVAIQGFGKVGSHIAYYLYKEGIKIIAITDSKSGVYDKKGLDIEKLIKYKKTNGTLSGFNQENITNETLFKLSADIIVPAAHENVLNEKNSEGVQAKAIVCGANIPINPSGIKVLKKNKKFIVPELIANGGGVMASYLEYSGSLSAQQKNKIEVLNYVKSKVQNIMRKAIDIGAKEKIDLYEAVGIIAVSSINNAISVREFNTNKNLK